MVKDTCPHHPVLADLLPSIADDHGLSPDTLLSSSSNVKRLLAKFSCAGLAGRVETRRWFTLFDGNATLSAQWHTMLFALLMSFLVAGIDPFSIAAITKARQDGDDFDAEHKEFKFKHEVLTTLLCQYTRKMVRSLLVVFARLRAHHGKFISLHTVPGFALRINMFWADLKDRRGDERALVSLSRRRQCSRAIRSGSVFACPILG